MGNGESVPQNASSLQVPGKEEESATISSTTTTTTATSSSNSNASQGDSNTESGESGKSKKKKPGFLRRLSKGSRDDKEMAKDAVLAVEQHDEERGGDRKSKGKSQSLNHLTSKSKSKGKSSKKKRNSKKMNKSDGETKREKKFKKTKQFERLQQGGGQRKRRSTVHSESASYEAARNANTVYLQVPDKPYHLLLQEQAEKAKRKEKEKRTHSGEEQEEGFTSDEDGFTTSEDDTSSEDDMMMQSKQRKRAGSLTVRDSESFFADQFVRSPATTETLFSAERLQRTTSLKLGLAMPPIRETMTVSNGPSSSSSLHAKPTMVKSLSTGTPGEAVSDEELLKALEQASASTSSSVSSKKGKTKKLSPKDEEIQEIDDNDDEEEEDLLSSDDEGKSLSSTSSSKLKNSEKRKSQQSPLLARRMMFLKDIPRSKSNSTSSLFIKSTMENPDREQLLKTVAAAISIHVEEGEAMENPNLLDIFNEKLYPVLKYSRGGVPSPETIYKFVNATFQAAQLSTECAVIILIYIERFMSIFGLTLHSSNWRRVILAAALMASKVWDDQSLWNIDFCCIFPTVTLEDMNELEREILELLQYNVSIKSSLYAKYYFELRKMAERESETMLKPLDKETAAKLESRSQITERKSKMQKTRSQSAGSFNLLSLPATLANQ